MGVALSTFVARGNENHEFHDKPSGGMPTHDRCYGILHG